jgi:hypothetical protein
MVDGILDVTVSTVERIATRGLPSPTPENVTYADDLVILCRKGKAEQALQRLRETTRETPKRGQG